MNLFQLYCETYNPQLDVPNLGSMFAIKDIDKWIDTLLQAMEQQITIVSDYDADGVCAYKVADYFFKLLGKSANVYIPQTSDGYGLSPASVDKLMQLYPDTQVILTLDNGINAAPGVDHSRLKYRVSTIVCDHHIGHPDTYPTSALSTICPHRHDAGDETSEQYRIACGTTVAFYLFNAYLQNAIINQLQMIDFKMKSSDFKHNLDNYRQWDYDKFRQLILSLDLKSLDNDLIALIQAYQDFQQIIPLCHIANVADVMPMTHTNRKLAQMAVEMYQNHLFNHHSSLDGLYSNLRQLLGYNFDLSKMGWNVTPLLNAPRRMYGDPTLAYQFINGESVIEQLMNCNEERKTQSEEQFQAIKSMHHQQFVDAKANGQKVMICMYEQLNVGLAGLIASKLVREYQLATIVVNTNGSGSGRAPSNFNLNQWLTAIKGSYKQVQGGGHASAVGCTIPPELVEPILRDPLTHSNAFESHSEPVARATIRLTQSPTLEDWIVFENELENYLPFCDELPEPIFQLTLPKSDCDHQLMGKTKNHLKLTYDGVSFIQWGGAQQFLEAIGTQLITVSGNFQINEFRNQKSLQLLIQSVEYA